MEAEPVIDNLQNDQTDEAEVNQGVSDAAEQKQKQQQHTDAEQKQSEAEAEKSAFAEENHDKNENEEADVKDGQDEQSA